MPRFTGRLAAAAVLALLASAGPAGAQGASDGDLRRENQRLKAAVSDLQQELDAARARITELEKQIERLKQASGKTAAPSPPATAPATEEVTIDETVATASPRALLQAMKQSYQEAIKDLEIGDPRTLEGPRQRLAYERAVRSWTGRVHREFRAPVEWHVRIVQVSDTDAGESILRAQAVDPRTHAALGDPFAVLLDQSLRHRVDQIMEHGEPDVLVVKGVLMPRVTMNPQRIEPGTFDKPPFIGPFAEFGFLIDAASITLAREVAPEPPPQPSTGS